MNLWTILWSWSEYFCYNRDSCVTGTRANKKYLLFCIVSIYSWKMNLFTFSLRGGRDNLVWHGDRNNWIRQSGSPSEPTLSSVTLRPIRKRSSAMKRLMQRFLWMVFLSLCRPRKKQNVKMHMAKQTSETTMPTRVMTVSSSLCSLPGPWRTTGWRERTYREERWIKCFAKAMIDHVCHNHLF